MKIVVQEGNIWIYAPNERILMVVDVIFPGWVPFRRLAVSEDIEGWIRGPDVALTFDFDVLIGGHNTRLGNRNDVLIQKRYVQLSVSPFVFACSNHAKTMTTSDTDAAVIAAAPATGDAADDRPIRPFTERVPQAKLDDLRRRIAATQWPEKETVAEETVADQSQGVPLATMQELARYWRPTTTGASARRS